MRILVIEDNKLLAGGMDSALKQQGFAVDVIHDGLEAESILAHQQYDLVILDLGLPNKDGMDILRDLRKRRVLTPVLIVSARDQLDQRITGLDAGADDYICKPFELDEIVARARALLRRAMMQADNMLTYGPIQINLNSRLITYHDEDVVLHRRELSVLEYLILNSGKVVSKEQIVASIASFNEELSATAIETYISRLRKRFSALQLRTVRGLGYLLEPYSHDA